MPPRSHSSSEGHGINALQTRARYKGLFTYHTAPTSRGYCILFTFVVGVLMITMGSVFYHVILIRPMSGTYPLHTPSMPLACSLIAMGFVLVFLSIGVTWKFGFDDGDNSLEEDSCSLAKDDVLDQNHQNSLKNPPA
ncbi:uncharacterized protein LOC135222077 [Macrobrachium nipponense]|uniref:uncharacterized protein LOC135222077 n=1 Tax=Macrobrachium nipponense TaxID=159736 RepID=UPI0030C85EE8